MKRYRRKATRRGGLSVIEASFAPSPKVVVRRAHRATSRRLRRLRRSIGL